MKDTYRNKAGLAERLVLEKYPHCSVGTYSEYPVSDQIAVSVPYFQRTEGVKKDYAWRPKFPFDLRVNDKILPVIVKAKIRTPERMMPHYRSVAREVTMARAAAIDYQEHFNEPLSIEKAVGFVIDSKGQKWSFYEMIEGQTELDNLPIDKEEKVLEEVRGFKTVMNERLLAIGIDAPGLRIQGANNIMICGDLDKPRFVLIDTEDWARVNLSK
jgi:hypothetical protein